MTYLIRAFVACIWLVGIAFALALYPLVWGSVTLTEWLFERDY